MINRNSNILLTDRGSKRIPFSSLWQEVGSVNPNNYPTPFLIKNLSVSGT